MKTCTKCRIEKDESEFSKDKNYKDGFYCYCKLCCKEKMRINYLKNREKVINGKKIFRKNNKELCRNRNKQRYLKYKEKILEDKKKYYQLNREVIDKKHKEALKKNISLQKRKKEYCKQYEKERKIKDPFFKLKKIIRNLITNSLKHKGLHKSYKTTFYLQCSPLEFQNHLGPKPKGNYELDHICPCAQAKNEEELIKLQHYSNFRWLSEEDNGPNGKWDKWTPEGEELCKILLRREWIY